MEYRMKWEEHLKRQMKRSEWTDKKISRRMYTVQGEEEEALSRPKNCQLKWLLNIDSCNLQQL